MTLEKYIGNRSTKVPSTDNQNNNVIADVIGSKDDSANNTSSPTIMNFHKLGYYHVHSPAEVYPEGANPILLTAGNTVAWGHGTKTEIIPASTITNNFDIHWVLVGSISAVDDYELKLYKGASGSETVIGTIAFSRSSTFSQEGNLPIQVPVEAANERISASLACGDGDGATCTIKLYYHIYPS